MANPNKFTAKEVLNKVLLDSSGNAVTANSVTSQEALNSVLDTTNNRLNMSLAGGTISGDVTISGDLTVNGDSVANVSEVVNGDMTITSSASNHPILTLENTNTDDSPAFLTFKKSNSGSANDGDEIGQFQYKAFNDAGTPELTTYADNYISAEDVSNGSEDGSMTFRTMKAGTLTQTMQLKSGDATFGGSVTSGNKYVIDGNTASNQKFQFHDDNVGLQRAGGSDRTANGNSLYISAFEDIVFTASGAVMGSQTEVMRIDGSSSSVGIGTTSPDSSHKLTIKTSATGGDWIIGQQSDGGQGFRIGADSGDDAFFELGSAGTSNAVVLQADGDSHFNGGNVGIGTTSPDSQFHLHGSTGIRLTDSNQNDNEYAEIKYDNGGNTNLYINNDWTNSNALINFQLAGSTKMAVRGDGNVGIGVTSPGEKLAVADGNIEAIMTTAGAGLRIIVDRVDTSDYAGFEARTGGNQKWFVGLRETGDDSLHFYDSSKDVLILDANSRISLSNNDSGGTSGGDSTSGNTIFGFAAGNSIASGGIRNSIVGHGSGYNLDTGTDNILIGKVSGFTMESEIGNVVIGNEAGEHIRHDTSDYNVFIGHQASTGGTGSRNQSVAIGYRAWGSGGSANNIGGAENVFIGSESGGGTWATAASDGNTAVGWNTMKGAMNGAALNTSVGKSALGALTTGDNNTAIGALALDAITTSSNNTAVGYNALTACGDSYNNVAIGKDAGDTITNTGGLNTVIGTSADVSTGAAENQIVIGNGATGVANNSVTLGNSAVTDVYMASDSGAKVHCLDVVPTGGVLKENLITNSGFGVWSNATLENVGSDFVTNGTFASDSDWSKNTGWTIAGGKGVASSAASTYAISQSISQTVVGKLYRVKVTISDYSAGAIFFHQIDGSGASQNFDSNGSHEFVVEMLTAHTTLAIRALGTTTLKIDDVSMYEVTPACIAADTNSLDGWGKSTNADLYREHDGSNTKDGSFYALYVKPTVAGQTCEWPKGKSEPTHLKRFAGRTVAFGCWIKSDNSSAGIYLHDNDAAVHSQHTGGGAYEWLEVTKTLASDIDEFQVVIRGYGETYASQPMLVFGNSIGSGNYTRPQGEIIHLETTSHRKLTDYDNVTISSDVYPVNLEAQSEGRIPKNAKAVQLRFTGKSSTVGAFMLLDNGSVRNNVHVYSQVSNVNVSGTAVVGTDANGDIGIERSDTWTSCYIYYDAVHLH